MLLVQCLRRGPGPTTGPRNTVFVEARYRATAKATGKAMDASAAHIWDFRNGKVVKFQQHTDTWQWTHVTGIEPKP